MNSKPSPRSGFSILKFLLATVIFLIVAVLVFLTFFLSPTAKWFANAQLSEILGTETSVEKVSIKLWSGDLEIAGVHVANPSEGSDQPALFSLGRLFIDIDAKSLFTDTIVIREITIDKPEVHGDRGKDGKFSFEKLKIMEPSPQEEPPAPSDDSGFSKGIQIDKISITGLAGSFSDRSDPKSEKSYKLQNLSFQSKTISLNLENAVSHLPDGIHFSGLAFSDAQFDYQTNENIPDPDGSGNTSDSASEAKTDTGNTESSDKTDSQGKEAEKEDGTNSPDGSDPTPKKEPSDPTEPIYIAEFSIKNFGIHYLDTPQNKKVKPLEAILTDLYIDAEDFGFDPDGLLKEAAGEVFSATMGFKIQQKTEGASPANFSAVAKSTVIGSDLPINAGAIQLTGFELATFKSIIPSGMESAIGGPGMDLYAKWFMSPDKLDGFVKITSSSNTVTKVGIGGTPSKPTFSGGDILMSVIGRPGRILSNFAGGALKGSMNIVGGATEATGNLLKGTGETVAGFGKGLLDTGKGLLTGNLKEAGKGISEATVGTVKNATKTVNKTSESAVGGVGDAYNSTTGNTRTADWRSSNSKRHDEFETGAKDWLENSTFPPKSDEKKKSTKAKPAASENPEDSPTATSESPVEAKPSAKSAPKSSPISRGHSKPKATTESTESAVPPTTGDDSAE